MAVARNERVGDGRGPSRGESGRLAPPPADPPFHLAKGFEEPLNEGRSNVAGEQFATGHDRVVDAMPPRLQLSGAAQMVDEDIRVDQEIGHRITRRPSVAGLAPPIRRARRKDAPGAAPKVLSSAVVGSTGARAMYSSTASRTTAARDVPCEPAISSSRRRWDGCKVDRHASWSAKGCRSPPFRWRRATLPVEPAFGWTASTTATPFRGRQRRYGSPSGVATPAGGDLADQGRSSMR